MSETQPPPERERERLGWLTESSVQPRKRRMIEGDEVWISQIPVKPVKLQVDSAKFGFTNRSGSCGHLGS